MCFQFPAIVRVGEVDVDVQSTSLESPLQDEVKRHAAASLNSKNPLTSDSSDTDVLSDTDDDDNIALEERRCLLSATKSRLNNKEPRKSCLSQAKPPNIINVEETSDILTGQCTKKYPKAGPLYENKNSTKKCSEILDRKLIELSPSKHDTDSCEDTDDLPCVLPSPLYCGSEKNSCSSNALPSSCKDNKSSGSSPQESNMDSQGASEIPAKRKKRSAEEITRQRNEALVSITLPKGDLQILLCLMLARRFYSSKEDPFGLKGLKNYLP